ncbi:MAG TPA: MaoC family dehydratase N-terminal domain-containing protein [Solirubrobacterales bacterium]|nr:MaoC family dehydratase N-terminal domain-containing protein [Solirubrobacterales bacterium]
MGSGATEGRELETVSFPIERSKLRELARTFKDDDPVWYDEGAAAAAGFDAVPLPPTATVLADHWRERGATFHVEAAGLDLSRVLHGEVSWEFLRPLRIGDELTATSTLVGDERRSGKRGGEMRLVTVETAYATAAGEVVARRRDTLIETAPR